MNKSTRPLTWRDLLQPVPSVAGVLLVLLAGAGGTITSLTLCWVPAVIVFFAFQIGVIVGTWRKELR